MPYQVVVPDRVKKELNRIDSRYRARIIAVLASLESDPHLGKKLEGEHRGERSCRVWPYRVIYRIKPHKREILIVKIGHRQGVY